MELYLSTCVFPGFIREPSCSKLFGSFKNDWENYIITEKNLWVT